MDSWKGTSSGKVVLFSYWFKLMLQLAVLIANRAKYQTWHSETLDGKPAPSTGIAQWSCRKDFLFCFVKSWALRLLVDTTKRKMNTTRVLCYLLSCSWRLWARQWSSSTAKSRHTAEKETETRAVQKHCFHLILRLGQDRNNIQNQLKP